MCVPYTHMRARAHTPIPTPKPTPPPTHKHIKKKKNLDSSDFLVPGMWKPPHLRDKRIFVGFNSVRQCSVVHTWLNGVTWRGLDFGKPYPFCGLQWSGLLASGPFRRPPNHPRLRRECRGFLGTAPEGCGRGATQAPGPVPSFVGNLVLLVAGPRQ